MIKGTEKINVLNYNENRVSVEVAPNKSYSFEPSVDGETPTVIPMSIDEIRYANNSTAFKNGTLFFDRTREEEIYNELNITGWKNILSNNAIREIILHPTYDGLSKIIAIKDSAEFERVRAVFHKLKLDKANDVSVRVAQIINTRYKELLNRQINTSIVLTKKDIQETVNSVEVDELKAQNAAMQKQMAQMQKLIEKMMTSQQNSTKDAENKNKEESPKEETKKSPGRPKKTS